jgi:hypothetical protein
MGVVMSFREKSAWITLVALILLTLFLATHLSGAWTLAPPPGGFLFHALTVGVMAFVAIEVVAHVVVAILAPRDAQAPRDERERLIALKATSLAAYVYALLSLSSVSLIHVGANQIGLAYCILFSFIVAEVVNYAARVVYYRRGL